MLKRTARKGFTLIELALSLVFIGILSVSVVLIINDTTASYRRGMTLNHINTVGMDLVDDLRSAVQNSSSKSVLNECIVFYSDGTSNRTNCENDGGYNFVSLTRVAKVRLEDDKMLGFEEDANGVDIPVYGAFCTGSYSYIWNSGYFEGNKNRDADNQYVQYEASGEVQNANPAYLKYSVAPEYSGDDGVRYNNGLTKEEFDEGNDEGNFVRLLKIRDDKRAVCASVVRNKNKSGGNDYINNTYDSYNKTNLGNEFDITVANGYVTLTEDPVELLLTDVYSDLAMYDLEVSQPAESSTRQNSFYAVSFILGTISGGIDVKAKGQSCNPPSDQKIGYFDYCAINKFSFAVQANGNGE
ncbi:type II secretion system protein [Candidatus Saccharibacteria bacterium]|nr:type II secretion system protein [Candidatus Saccharibacteria bacterium]